MNYFVYAESVSMFSLGEEQASVYIYIYSYIHIYIYTHTHRAGSACIINSLVFHSLLFHLFVVLIDLFTHSGVYSFTFILAVIIC